MHDPLNTKCSRHASAIAPQKLAGTNHATTLASRGLSPNQTTAFAARGTGDTHATALNLTGATTADRAIALTPGRSPQPRQSSCPPSPHGSEPL